MPRGLYRFHHSRAHLLTFICYHGRAAESASAALTIVKLKYIFQSPITRPPVGTPIYCDAFGRMMTQGTTGAYTNFLYSPTGQRLAVFMGTGSTLRNYYLPLVAGMQTVYDSTGLKYFRHTDWLESSRFATAASGTLQYRLQYAPYGETYSESGSPDRGFTGNTQDVIAGVQGIYDFLFRQHASSQGRWLVPDPAGLAAVEPTNPQTWNRYAYVGNNPLSRTDPLGLRLVDCSWDGCGHSNAGGYYGGGSEGVYVNGIQQTVFNTSGLGGNEVVLCPNND